MINRPGPGGDDPPGRPSDGPDGAADTPTAKKIKGARKAEPASGAVPLIWGTRWAVGGVVYAVGGLRSGEDPNATNLEVPYGMGRMWARKPITAYFPEVPDGAINATLTEAPAYGKNAEAIVLCEGGDEIEIRGFIWGEVLVSATTAGTPITIDAPPLPSNAMSQGALPEGLDRIVCLGGNYTGPSATHIFNGTLTSGADFFPNGNQAGRFGVAPGTTWPRSAVLELTGLPVARLDQTPPTGNPPLMFEVQGLCRGSGDHANPADVMLDIWARAGQDSAQLDVETYYRAYCEDHGFLVSRLLDQETDALELLSSLASETNSAFAWVAGVLVVMPLTDDGTVTATSMAEGDISTEGVTVERIPQHRRFNHFTVQYLRADSIQGDTPDSGADDTVARRSTEVRKGHDLHAKWVATPAHAATLSYLMAHRSWEVANQYRWVTSVRWCRVTPGDILSLSSARLGGLSAQAVRVLSVEDLADGGFEITAEEYLGTVVPTPTVWTPEGGGNGGGGIPPAPPYPTTQTELDADIAAIEAQLADMISDSRLVSTEKRALANLLAPAFAEHNILMQRAIAFTSARIDPAPYNDAMARCWAYCVAEPPASGPAASGLEETGPFTNGLGLTGAVTGWPDGNAGHTTGTPPSAANWDTWITTTGDTYGTIVIDGPTLRDVVLDLVMERQLLTHEMAGSLQQSIDAITAQIGQVATDGYLNFNEKRAVYLLARQWSDEATELQAQGAAQNLADTGPGDVLYDYSAAITALRSYWTAAIATDNDPDNLTTENGLGMAAMPPTESQLHTWLVTVPDIAILRDTFIAKHMDVARTRNDLYLALHADTADTVAALVDRVAAWASDSTVTRGEKRPAFAEARTLFFESQSLVLEAQESNISARVASALSDYRLALYALQEYLNNLGCPPAPGTSPAINEPTDANLTTWLAATTSPNDANNDCQVVRATWISKYSDVYVSRAALRKAISDAHGAALGDLDRIRQDGWLSAAEKADLLSQYTSIVREAPAFDAQALAQGITTHKDNYDAAIAAVIAYMKAAVPGNGVTPTSAHGLGMVIAATTGIPVEAEITAWLALTSGSAPANSGDIAVHSATLRLKFANCYSTGAQLLAELQRDAWANSEDALKRIENQAADGVISSTEKPSLWREYVELIQERATIDQMADASAFSGSTAINTAHDTYRRATWLLQRYWAAAQPGGLGATPNTTSATDADPWQINTPLDGDRTQWQAAGNANNIPGDTLVTQSTLVSTFQAVYTARAALQKAIQDFYLAGSFWVQVQVSSQVVQISKDTGARSPGSITFTVSTGGGLSGTPTFAVLAGTITGGAGAFVGSGMTRTLDTSLIASDLVTIRVTVGSYSDTVSLALVREGSDALVALLSNEAHTLPATSTGSVSDFTGCSTTIRIFKGSTDVSSQWGTPTKVDTNVTSTVAGKTITVTNMTSGLSVLTGYVDITVAETLNPSNTLTKRFTITKSVAGATGPSGTTGVDALFAMLTNEAYVASCDSVGNPLDLTNCNTQMVVMQGATPQTGWAFSASPASSAPVTYTLNASTGVLQVLTFDNSISTYQITITATKAGNPTLTRKFDLAKARIGNTGPTGPKGDTGTAGAAGARGSRWLYAPTTFTYWRQDIVDSAYATAQIGVPVLGDQVTQYKTTTPQFSETRTWDGAAWQPVTVRIDGSLLVEESVVTKALAARSVTAGRVASVNWDNLIPNANSELGAAAVGVDPEGNGLAQDTGAGQAHTGSWCRYLSNYTGSTRPGYDSIYWTTQIACAPGDKFYCEVWSRKMASVGSGFGRLIMSWRNAAGTEISTTITNFTPTTTYAKYGHIGTAPAGASFVIFTTGTYQMPNNQEIYFDDAYARRMVDGGLVVSDSLQTSDYQYTGTLGASDEVATRGARLRNGVALGSDIPAIITSPAGIKIGNKILAESGVGESHAVGFYLQHNPGNLTVMTIMQGFGMGLVGGNKIAADVHVDSTYNYVLDVNVPKFANRCAVASGILFITDGTDYRVFAPRVITSTTGSMGSVSGFPSNATCQIQFAPSTDWSFSGPDLLNRQWRAHLILMVEASQWAA